MFRLLECGARAYDPRESFYPWSDFVVEMEACAFFFMICLFHTLILTMHHLSVTLKGVFNENEVKKIGRRALTMKAVVIVWSVVYGFLAVYALANNNLTLYYYIVMICMILLTPFYMSFIITLNT